MSSPQPPTNIVKCLVWDLDGTVWDGVLLEGDCPAPRTAVVDAISALDGRGVLHAVASRGDHSTAEAHLAEVGLLDWFVHLEVGWGPKSEALQRIAEQLNIGIDSLAFIDNDPVERAEVQHAHPQVRCYQETAAAELPYRAEFQPPFVTAESGQRRAMCLAERRRQTAEAASTDHRTDFLAELGLVMTIRAAGEDDLARAHELTVRTNQLNSTGRTYSMDELREMSRSPRFDVLVAGLEDKFGSYGTIGLSVTEKSGSSDVLRLLLMSCRVMSRGVGGVLLHQVVGRALAAGRRPCAEFVPTSVNRMMLVTLRFAGFRPDPHAEGLLVYPGDGAVPLAPDHVRVVFDNDAEPVSGGAR